MNKKMHDSYKNSVPADLKYYYIIQVSHLRSETAQNNVLLGD